MKSVAKFTAAAIFTAASVTVPTFNSPVHAQVVAPPAQSAPKPTTQPLATSTTQPTADVATLLADIQTNIDTKQFPAAVKGASKVLAIHGPAAAGVDRFAVTMLKGYAQAGTKAISTAVATFKQAMKETKDPHEKALARWTAELFHTANSITYAPKAGGAGGAGGQKRGPFDLLDPDQRKDAFASLLDDDLAALEPKLKSATISQKLPEIFPVIQQIVDLNQLDQIANGNDDKTSGLGSTLLDHARNLLANALKSDWTRVNDIDAHANITRTVPTQVVINNALVTQTITKKNGLSDANRSELNNIISVCQKIHDAAEAFLPLAKSDKDWSTILSDSDRVSSRASDVLNADYGATASSGSTVNDDGTSGTGIGTGIDNQQFGGGNPIYPGSGRGYPQQPYQGGQPPQPTTPTQPPATHTQPPVTPPQPAVAPTPAPTTPTTPTTPPVAPPPLTPVTPSGKPPGRSHGVGS